MTDIATQAFQDYEFQNLQEYGFNHYSRKILANTTFESSKFDELNGGRMEQADYDPPNPFAYVIGNVGLLNTQNKGVIGGFTEISAIYIPPMDVDVITKYGEDDEKLHEVETSPMFVILSQPYEGLWRDREINPFEIRLLYNFNSQMWFLRDLGGRDPPVPLSDYASGTPSLPLEFQWEDFPRRD